MSSVDLLLEDSDSQDFQDAQDMWNYYESSNKDPFGTQSYNSETPDSQLHNSRVPKRRRFEDMSSTTLGETTDNNSSTEHDMESTNYSGYDKTTDDESSSEGESPTIEDSAAKPLTYKGIKNIVDDLEMTNGKAALAILEHTIEQGLPLYSGKANDIIELNTGNILTGEERLKMMDLTKKLGVFLRNNANEIAGKKLTYAQIIELINKNKDTPFALLILRDLLVFHRPIFESVNSSYDDDSYWKDSFSNQLNQAEYDVLYTDLIEVNKENTIPNGQIGMFGRAEDITINNF